MGHADKAAGLTNEAAGKIKQGVGKAVGSDKLQGEGAARELKGDAQRLKGDAKNAIKDGVNKVADAANKKTLTCSRGREGQMPFLPVNRPMTVSFRFVMHEPTLSRGHVRLPSGV